MRKTEKLLGNVNKLLFGFGCVLLLSLGISDRVNAADPVFHIENGVLKSVETNGATTIDIPNTVTVIGEEVFLGRSWITSITVPSSVTTIGYGAFHDCSSLTGITIPNSVTSIGEGAFYGCSSLTGITIPNSVTSIGNSAFYGCSSLTGITIPNSVTSIGNSAFAGCSSLTGITIPNSVTSIGRNAFSGCSSLTSITISDSIIEISPGMFFDCSSLTSIDLPAGLKTVGFGAFSGCSSLTSIDLPDGVESIGGGAFVGCSSLTSIVLPNSVTSVGEKNIYSNLRDCTSLESITFSKGITEIHTYWFDPCENLKTIAVDDDNTTYCAIDGVLFSKDKTKLICCPKGKTGSYTVPEEVTEIGEDAFLGCTGLTSVEISEGVRTLANCCFKGCTGLTSINIPKSVNYIYNSDVFLGCSNLTNITVDNENTTYGDINGVLSNKDQTEIMCCPQGKKGLYRIPDSISSIKTFAFSGCSSLTGITLPNSVTSIGNSAFAGCNSLVGITLPNSVTSIGYRVFAGCSKLTSITIPNSVTSIDNSAFDGCSSLAGITIPNSVTSIGGGAFSGCSSLAGITIPNSVTSIGGSAFSGCSNLTGITLPTGVTSIDSFTFYNCSSLTGITIPNSVTSIGMNAFSGCSSLTGMTIPNSVTSIGNSSFYGCSSLTGMTIPNSVTSIGNSAFSGCSSLTGITLPTGVTSIGSFTFCDCSSLTGITLPNSVTSIGNSAFSGCSSLTGITLPTGVTSIGMDAFSRCSSLTSVRIPKSVTSIDIYAFSFCDKLERIIVDEESTSFKDDKGVLFNKDGTELVCCPAGLSGVYIIPQEVKTIGSGAFAGCRDITMITIPDGVTSIGSYAFSGCSSLESINIPEGVVGNLWFAFYDCISLKHIVIPNGIVDSTESFVNCSSLEYIVIPRSLKYFETYADGKGLEFYNCTNLKDFYYEGSEVEWFENVTIISREYSKTVKPTIHFNSSMSVAASEVTLNPTATVEIGKSIILEPLIMPADATNKKVTWSDGGTGHATVDENGVVTGVAAGTETITVTTDDGGLTATCTVTVEKEHMTYDASGYTGEYDGQAHTISVTVDKPVSGAVIKYGNTADACNLDAAPTRTAPGEQEVFFEITADNFETVKSSKKIVIEKRKVRVGNIKAENKEYDAKTTATLDYSSMRVEGALDGEDVSATATGTFDSASIGKNKTVKLSALTLSGADKDNYQLASNGQQEETKAEITVKQVTVTGIKAKDKKFNGTAAATLDYSSVDIDGLVPGDRVGVTATGTFADENVGSNKTVTISDIKLTGAAAGNYKLSDSGNQTETKASITKADLPGSSITVNKNYLYSRRNSDWIDLNKVVPKDCGSVTWLSPNTTGNLTYVTQPEVSAAGVLTYLLESETGSAAGAVKVVAQSTNYSDIEVIINISVVQQTPTVLKTGSEVVLKNSKLVYGQKLSELRFNNAVFVTNDAAQTRVSGTLSWKNPRLSPDAGTITAVWVFSPTDIKYAPCEDIINITVVKAPIHPTVSLTGWVSGQTPNTPVVTGNTDNGAVTYQYASRGSSSYGTDVPTAAGDYTVKAIISETANYQGAEVTSDFTVSENTSGLANTKDESIAVKSIKFKKKTVTLNLFNSNTLTLATPIFKPSNATDTTLTWSSSNTEVATVTDSGVVTGIRTGTVKITARTTNGKKATCTVKVKGPVEVKSVKLNKKKATLDLAKIKKTTVTLKASFSPSSATDKTITWTSSDENVAVVNTNGLKATVKGVHGGTAIITATSVNGKTATCKVTVKEPVKVTSISLNSAEETVKLKKKTTLKATVIPTNATNKKVKWTSSDSKTASVTSSGKVTGKKEGTAVITVTTRDGEYQASCVITVTK